jgi:hypothetical protein
MLPLSVSRRQARFPTVGWESGGRFEMVTSASSQQAIEGRAAKS